jgi:two-component system heavy metal sensor histidine kinase CusS
LKSLRSGSLVARATLLFALIVGLVVGGLGAYLHREASAALMVRADYALLGRVAHFRTLLQDLYTVDQLETHPAVF